MDIPEERDIQADIDEYPNERMSQDDGDMAISDNTNPDFYVCYTLSHTKYSTFKVNMVSNHDEHQSKEVTTCPPPISTEVAEALGSGDLKQMQKKHLFWFSNDEGSVSLIIYFW